MGTLNQIRFYFSFRSPYAWLAAERLQAELGDLPVTIELIPIYPTKELFPNDPVSLPNKVRYIVQDVVRLTRQAGLKLRFPSVADPDWALPHAAFLGAQAEGAARPFMLEMFRSRWSLGLDLGADNVICEAAERAGLDAGKIVTAAHSEQLQSQVADNFRRGIEEDRIFGVPSFVYGKHLFWGQDRMQHLREAVLRTDAGTQPGAN
jgi:2-hydroxychromene-2-carboxylate isomerase